MVASSFSFETRQPWPDHRRKCNQRPPSPSDSASLTRRVAALDEQLTRARTISEEQRARNKTWDEEWDRQCERRRVEAEASQARWKAINEFDRQYLGERMRAVHPGIDDARRERRERLNMFLAARGMDPEPSRDPD
jgi:hypothetical protein